VRHFCSSSFGDVSAWFSWNTVFLFVLFIGEFNLTQNMMKKECMFKDVQAFRDNEGSTILTKNFYLNKRTPWGKFTGSDVFGVSEEDFNPLHVLCAIFEVDVGVAGDNLAETFVSEVAGHNEDLLGLNGMLKDIVHRHQKVLRRFSYSFKESDDAGTTISAKKASLLVWQNLTQTFPEALLGSKDNWDVLKSNLRHLISQGLSGLMTISSLVSMISVVLTS